MPTPDPVPDRVDRLLRGLHFKLGPWELIGRPPPDVGQNQLVISYADRAHVGYIRQNLRKVSTNPPELLVTDTGAWTKPGFTQFAQLAIRLVKDALDTMDGRMGQDFLVVDDLLPPGEGD